MGTVTVRETTICPNYVNGQWVESRSGKKLLRANPANLDDVLGFTPLSSRDEIREAVEAARRALPAWRDTPAPVRGKYVMQAARLMVEEKAELARLLTREEGKTVSESLGEIVRTVNILEYTAGEARRLTGETLPSELPRNFIYTIRQPLGVVGLITPWNFPIAVPVWKIAPALICGNNPVVVLEDADLELAADCTVMGAFGSTGQRCTATSRVIVAEAVADKFVGMLAERARKLKVGNGAEPGTGVGPSVDEAQFKKVQEYLEIGKREGKLICGGERLRGGAYDRGWFTPPTIFDRGAPDARLAQEEAFGPVLAVIRVKDFDEAVRVANGVRYGLAASIFSTNANHIFEFAERIECGVVHLN